MRDPLKNLGRLQHMLEMAFLLESEKTKYSLEIIRNDRVAFFGLSKIVEIIGEAAYKITKEFKESHKDLPWKQIEGMRHILVHGYFSISPEVLWDVIENDIPSMIPVIDRYIDELKE
ncbi:MAG: DUF86 domain-containing protein [Muribaculaceae bacterium]|nr:DUF86 domain-containing protein [Muribaculaceae bacterium]